MFQELSIKNVITFLLVLFVSSKTLISADNCSGIFKFNFNDSNSVDSGSIQFLLEQEKHYEDLVLEVIFGFQPSTISEKDKPTIKFFGREFMDGLGENISLDVYFNLERRIPSIAKISISSELNNFYKILCENVEQSISVIQIRASSSLSEAQQEIVTKTNELPVYTCKYGVSSFWFNNMDLNETHPHFVPLCEAASNSIPMVFLYGKVHTLTSDICDKFPNITYYDVSDMGIERINSNAFNGCYHLTDLDLTENNLTSLPNNLFVNNKLLESVDFSDNKFRNIDVNVFTHTRALKQLGLNGNQLEKFPFDDMPVLPNLKMLWMGKNNLSSLNAGAVMEKCPNLKELNFNQEDFSKEQSKKIKTSFEDYNVTVIIWPW